jgi:hypothetical protein
MEQPWSGGVNSGSLLRRVTVQHQLSDFLYRGVSMIPAIVGARLRSRSRLASLAAVVAVAAVASPFIASAQTGRINGSGISKVAHDTRKLTVEAQNGSSGSSSGTVRFIHNSPAGLTRFRGTVSCVRVSGGTAQVSGVIDKGETATGALLDGKAFAFTINTSSSPQTFSLPNYADAGGIAACSGGRPETVPVTEDGFKLQ